MDYTVGFQVGGWLVLFYIRKAKHYFGLIGKRWLAGLAMVSFLIVMPAQAQVTEPPSSSPSQTYNPSKFEKSGNITLSQGQDVTAGKVEALSSQTELQATRAMVKANPSDIKARFNLAELLRKAGRHREAAQEYLEAANIEPTNYACYHQVAMLNADASQIEDGIDRLTALMAEKPNDLMLRVALSELLEKKGDFYQAARTLVDLTYKNMVPEKYQNKVNARIHFLLAKAKDGQPVEQSVDTAEELDALPPPLPESTLRKDVATAKLKESKVMRAVGNAPLLP